MSTFQSHVLNASTSTTEIDIGEEERERRRLALQHALTSCLSADQMAQGAALL